MQKQISVLIVDDSALIRDMFSDMLSSAPDIKVLGTAVDPYDAREKIKQLNPDVLTLDIEMPKMDGISFLEKIMSLRPMPVIMVSTLTQKGADATIRALEIGAYDYISKPIHSQTKENICSLRDELIEKVRNAAIANISSSKKGGAGSKDKKNDICVFRPAPTANKRLIAVGASTGGVEALREFFLRMPENSPPVVVTQHMPEAFTKSFAARLNSLSNMNISEAAHHDRLNVGCAYIAPGNKHLKIAKIGGDFVCKLEDSQPVSGHRPSVDVLFKSVAETAGDAAVGVILTGMGKDGAEGMKIMRDAGAYNIGQSKTSCVVYGMPQVAHNVGATHIEMAVHEIPGAVLRICEGKSI